MNSEYYNYYFKYIDGTVLEGEKITVEILPELSESKAGKQITRVVHDESTNGLYITYEGTRYYEAYHFEY